MIMNETITLPESIVCVVLCLVVLLIIFAGLFGYFKGKADRLETEKEDL